MQDKINNVTKNGTNRSYTKKEDRLLHIEKWKQSGLSMSEYCRQYELPLSSFSTWSRLDNKDKAVKFKPIVIKPPQISQAAEPNNIIEILVSQQIKLRMLNVTESSLIVDIVRSLSNAINN